MEPAIRIEGLSKIFSDGWGRKGHTALEPLTLEVSSGQVIGVFGGNGSGKSTLLKLLCGLLPLTAGKVEIAYLNPVDAARQNRIGYLPERPGFPGHQKIAELLAFYGQLSGLSDELLRQRVQACLKLCQLEALAEQPVRKLSKGGLQRLAIAQTLVHSPEVYLWDEPMDGLDPLAREGVESLVKTLKEDGKTVLISSHLVESLERVCDQVLILHKGRSIFFGPPEFQSGMQGWLLDRLREQEATGG